MSENHIDKIHGGKFLSIESIFKWKPVIYEENLREYEFQSPSDNEFHLLSCVSRLVKSYHMHSEDLNKSLEIIDDLEKNTSKWRGAGEGSSLFRKIEDSYNHVVLASKSFLLLKNQQNHEAVEVLKKIRCYDEMDDQNKAGLHGIRSTVFALYSNEETQKALANIDKAIKMDPKNPLWLCLKGLYMRKNRKLTNPFEAPSLLEKELFEDALKQDPNNTEFKLHVADVYLELAGHAKKRQNLCSNFLPKDFLMNENLRENIDKKIELAAAYYKKSANDYSSVPYLAFICAEGLIKLPRPFDDFKLAKKLLKEGLKKDPDNIKGNMLMAFWSEKFDKNLPLAEQHLKKCQEFKVFEADLNMVRLSHNKNAQSFDAIETLSKLLQKYEEKPRHAIIYSQIVSYYLFSKYDLKKACEYAMKFYSLSTTSSCMRVHRSCFVSSIEPFSLIDVLTDEVKFKMFAKNTPNAIRVACEEFNHFMNFQNIPIVQGLPQNFRKQILEGKLVTINSKCTNPPKKYFKKKEVADREAKNERPNHGNDIKNNFTKNFNKSFKKNVVSQKSESKKTLDEVSTLPSLMDNLIIDPCHEDDKTNRKVEKEILPTKDYENPLPQKTEDSTSEQKRQKKLEQRKSDSSINSEDEKLIKILLKELKKQKKERKSTRHSRKTYDNGSESESKSHTKLLKKLYKDFAKKKCSSDSDSDSEPYRRKRDRRDRSRERYSDSDNSRRYRRHRKRHERHSSSGSDYRSKYDDRYHDRRKKHSRHYRDESSQDRRRRRSDSSDTDFGYKKSRNRRNRSSSSCRREKRDYDSKIEKTYSRRKRDTSTDGLSKREHSPRDKRGPSPSNRRGDLREFSRKEMYHNSCSSSKGQDERDTEDIANLKPKKDRNKNSSSKRSTKYDCETSSNASYESDSHFSRSGRP